MNEYFSKGNLAKAEKNKGAMAGLPAIVLSVFIVVFCYFIAPDPTPCSNRIILEIGGQKPGFAIMILAFNLYGNGLRDALNVRGEL